MTTVERIQDHIYNHWYHPLAENVGPLGPVGPAPYLAQNYCMDASLAHLMLDFEANDLEEWAYTLSPHHDDKYVNTKSSCGRKLQKYYNRYTCHTPSARVRVGHSSTETSEEV